jgi:hypothetical protein
MKLFGARKKLTKGWTPKSMRCFVLLLALCLASGCQTQPQPQANAPEQQKSPEQQKGPATVLETFMGKKGRLLLKETYDLAHIGGRFGSSMDVKALTISEPNSTQKIKGLRVEVNEGGRLERSNISFIDMDELESLSQGIAYMMKVANDWAGAGHDPYTEVIYVSKGEFEVGFYQKGKETAAFCKSGNISSATNFISVADLPRVKTAVDQGLALLKTK